MDRAAIRNAAVIIRNVALAIFLALLLALLSSAIRGSAPLFNGSYLEGQSEISAVVLNFKYISDKYIMTGFVMGMIAAQVELYFRRTN
ncbi:MAG TPA: hypothetical protein VIL07_00320 [Symbiobacteriaceae bacterium]